MIAELGARLASPFWASQAGTLSNLANVPDEDWSQAATKAEERPNHWYAIDSDVPGRERGKAIRRVAQLARVAVQALRDGEKERAIAMAGVLAHYVGDLSQPLHVTRNHDGWETGDPGIHYFFEIRNVETRDPDGIAKDALVEAKRLLGTAEILMTVGLSPAEMALEEARRAHRWLGEIIDEDLALGRGDVGGRAMLEIAKLRIGDGIATYALVLAEIEKAAGGAEGRLDPRATGPLTIPAWVPPDLP
jgi:hypothetical protein